MFPFVSLQTRSQAFGISFPQGFLKVENKSLSIKGSPVFCKHLSYLQRGCRGSQAEEEKSAFNSKEKKGWTQRLGRRQRLVSPKVKRNSHSTPHPPRMGRPDPRFQCPMSSQLLPRQARHSQRIQGAMQLEQSSLPVTDGPSPGSRGPKIPGLWHNTKRHRSCLLDLSWFKENEEMSCFLHIPVGALNSCGDLLWGVSGTKMQPTDCKC